jgi:hypothetical protein
MVPHIRSQDSLLHFALPSWTTAWMETSRSIRWQPAPTSTSTIYSSVPQRPTTHIHPPPQSPSPTSNCHSGITWQYET